MLVEPTVSNQISSENENIAEKTNLKHKPAEPEVIIPKYTVERVEILSECIYQGKLYVTIDENQAKKVNGCFVKNW